MSLGIALQHVHHVAREDREVRTDHAGILGVVLKARWPDGAVGGDYIELFVEDLASFEADPMSACLDSATRVAVRSFFVNGGVRTTVLGVCIESARDLIDTARLELRFGGLVDRLRDDDDISMLLMPALAWLPVRRVDGGPVFDALPGWRLLLRHCREMTNRFLLIDPPKGAEEDVALSFAAALRELRDVDVSYGALYWPWIQSRDVALPPSGAVAGIYARTDLANAPHGVRVAPANQEIKGYTHSTIPVSWREAERLIEAGLNPVLEQQGRGLVVWGARTLSTDPRWRQLTSRRIVGLIIERMRRDAEWVVFEAQRPELWETVARMGRSRLDLFWRVGLLTGESEGDEYHVQCDAELNPPAIRDAGQVRVKVLLRPTAATEFIDVELALGGQPSSGGGLNA